MQTVSQKAKAFRAAKEKLGTIKDVAKHFDVSVATVSRYLALSEDDLKNVDDGNQPIRGKKHRSIKSTMPSDQKELTVMEYGAHSEFFIVTQAAKQLKVSVAITRSVLEKMETKGLLNKNTEYLPHVFSLTLRGCVLMAKEKPKHFFSGAAIHQRLMRNAVELDIQATNNTARFLSRTACWARGIFPAVGEHYLEFTSGGQKENALVIIDDYGIAPLRLRKALLRKHDMKKSFADGNVVVTWPDVVTRYLVYTTSEQQKRNFEKYYSHNSDEFLIKPVIRHIPAIWN